jgi:hypothetical protein
MDTTHRSDVRSGQARGPANLARRQGLLICCGRAGSGGGSRSLHEQSPQWSSHVPEAASETDSWHVAAVHAAPRLCCGLVLL